MAKLTGVIRYSGEPLPAKPRIAVVTNDALGNYAVATPLLRLLREQRRPGRLDYYGGHRVQEISALDAFADRSFPLHGTAPGEAVGWAEGEGPYDLVINIESTAWTKAFSGLLAGEEGWVCGPCIGRGGRAELPFADDARGALWADRRWIAPDLTERYPFLDSGFIGEIFCRLAYLEDPIPPYTLAAAPPNRPVPDVLIAMSASLPEKLWPVERWEELVRRIDRAGWTVGLLGAKPARQKEHWRGGDDEDRIVETGGVEDLRGQFTLPEVVGALADARQVVTLDNGILHFACATTTPITGLFRHGIHRLWAPPNPSLSVVVPPEDGKVADLTVDQVWSAITLVQ